MYKVDLTPKRQKFPDGCIIYIDNDLPDYMRHFTSGVFGIVQHTHGGMYGSNSYDSYSLYILKKDGKWTSIAWYKENQLNVVTDITICKKIEESFKNRSY